MIVGDRLVLVELIDVVEKDRLLAIAFGEKIMRGRGAIGSHRRLLGELLEDRSATARKGQGAQGFGSRWDESSRHLQTIEPIDFASNESPGTFRVGA